MFYTLGETSSFSTCSNPALPASPACYPSREQLPQVALEMANWTRSIWQLPRPQHQFTAAEAAAGGSKLLPERVLREGTRSKLSMKVTLQRAQKTVNDRLLSDV